MKDENNQFNDIANNQPVAPTMDDQWSMPTTPDSTPEIDSVVAQPSFGSVDSRVNPELATPQVATASVYPLAIDQELTVATPSVASTDQVPSATITFDQPMLSNQPSSVTPTTKKSKAPLIISIVIGLFAVFGLGGSVLAYNVWYQNPEKVISDALINAVKAKSSTYNGSVELLADKNSPSSYGIESVKVEFDGKSIGGNSGSLGVSLNVKHQGKEYKLNGTGMVDSKKDLYVKIDGAKKLMSEIAAIANLKYEEFPSEFRATIDKIDNKWIQIPSDEMEKYAKGYKSNSACIDDAVSKLGSDKSMSSELTRVYTDNKFVTINKTLPTKDGAIGYDISLVEAKLESFSKAAKSTAFGKAMSKCNESTVETDDIKIDSSESSLDLDKVHTEIRIGQFDHQLRSVAVKTDRDGVKTSVVVNTDFTATPSVVAPKDFVPFSELQEAIKSIYNTPQTTTLDSSYDSSTNSSLDSGSLDESESDLF